MVAGLVPARGVSFIRLGHVEVRGKAEAQVMYQVEWREDAEADCTMHSDLMSELNRIDDQPVAEIQLRPVDVASGFVWIASSAGACGRPRSVPDRSQGIAHARLEWRQGPLCLPI